MFINDFVFTKCRFIQCTHLKMYYITPTEYDEFISIIRAARSAFQMTPGGMVQFNELLQALRRYKDLYFMFSCVASCLVSFLPFIFSFSIIFWYGIFYNYSRRGKSVYVWLFFLSFFLSSVLISLWILFPRSKSCKKELWTRITNALQQPTPVWPQASLGPAGESWGSPAMVRRGAAASTD